MSDTLHHDAVTGVDTTGHDWDGIKELNNPLPRWWLWCFYITIVWGIIYTIAYPAWPLVQGATAGVLGFSTRAAMSSIRAVAWVRGNVLSEKTSVSA